MTRWRRRRRLGAVVAATLVAATAVVLGAPRAAAPRPYLRDPLRADLARARDAQWIAAARALPRPPARSPTVARHGPSLLDISFTPACFAGSRALCDALDDLRLACDGGDPRACRSLGGFFAATPHVTMASFAFAAACTLGDAAGCAGLALDGTGVTTGLADAREVLDAYRHDLGALPRLCTRGVALACERLADLRRDDPAARRGYLTDACELGSRVACDQLAVRLTPGCVDDCLPPDPVDAQTAAALACEAGFARSCTLVAR